jgi:hypothetical protein
VGGVVNSTSTNVLLYDNPARNDGQFHLIATFLDPGAGGRTASTAALTHRCGEWRFSTRRLWWESRQRST